MSPEDKRLIREFRDDLQKLAKKSQVIVQRGYILSFNINSDKGAIDKFDVKAPIDIDDDEVLPTGRAN